MTDRNGLLFGDADAPKRREDVLREEANASSTTRRARILHELGEQLEAAGNLTGAVKEYEAALESSSAFSEAVEGLWRLVERRRALGDASQIAAALLECATNNEERARALLLQASLLDQAGDTAGAVTKAKDAVFEDAARVSPSGWLTLELLGAKLSDPELQRTALESRAEAAADPYWKGLLLLDVAERVASAGESERATELLLSVLDLENGPRFGAALALERLARLEAGQEPTKENLELLARALETQGALLDDAHHDAERARVLGVPRFRRTPAHRTEVWLRAAYVREQLQEWPAAAAALENALASVGELLPEDPVHTVLSRSRLRAARATGDDAAALQVSQEHLSASVTRPLSTTFALEYAAHAAQSGDEASAFEALGFALGQDPLSIPARAFQYDWLAQDADTPRLAVALDALAAQSLSSEAKSRLRTLSAILWVTRGKDVSAAEKALSQAALPAEASARLSRALARVAGDVEWYARAANDLVRALPKAASEEVVSVLFELVALRVRLGQRDAAYETLERMEQYDEGRIIAMVVRAHLPETAEETKRELFEKLRDSATNTELVRIFASAAAFTGRLGPETAPPSIEQEEHRVRSARELETLAKGEPDDLVLSVAASSALAQASLPLDAASLLEATAATLEDPLIVASLRLEAGFLRFRAGDATAALSTFQAAEDTFAESTQAVIPWAKRALGSTDADARRDAIDVELSGSAPDEGALSLERFALELREGNADEALAFLGKAETHADAHLVPATALLRLIWPRAAGDAVAYDRAATTLAELGANETRSNEWVFAERARRGREEGNQEWVRAAKAWYDANPTVSAALEWLAAAGTDPDEREPALRAMADVLPEAEQEALLAVAALVGPEPTNDTPLLGGEGPASRLANLEMSLPGCEPNRRLHALSEVGDALGEDSELESCALAGWAALSTGQAGLALELFSYVTSENADHLAAWEGQRAAAEALGNVEARALAAEQLGARAGDAEQAALFWEEAATNWFLLGEAYEARGERALEASVERDPACTLSFERLFRRVRERKAHERLLALIDVRLPIVVSESEREKLTWERARALRELAKFDAAMEALDAVRALNPEHVGALALSGEIFIRRGQFEEAAEILAYLATVEDAPARNRVTAGVTAVDLFENKLGQATRALEVLVALDEAGLTTLPVRERLAKVAAKVGAWDRAAEVLERLMTERQTTEGQTEAARLAMVIHRDRRKAAYDATNAVLKVLEALPGDEEALDLLLLVDVEPSRKQALLSKGRDALREGLEQRTPDKSTLRLFAEIAHALHDDANEHAALSAASAFGDAQARELATGTFERCPTRPTGVLGEPGLTQLVADRDDGPISRLYVHLAATLAEAFGPNLGSLGLGRRDRVDAKAGSPLRDELHAWAHAFGIGEFELYVGGKDPNGIQGIAGSPHVLVLGSSVRAPFTANQRAKLAIELVGIARGTSILRHRDNTSISAIVLSAANLAKVMVAAPSAPYPVQAEVDKALSKAISRKSKSGLAEILSPLTAKSSDATTWLARALLTQARAGVVASGHLAATLEEGFGVLPGRSSDSLAHDRRAQELLRFHLSRTYSDLRMVLRLEGAS
ncbi:MAG: hypothetical protein U0174_20805 [Polyangiaceae bacterium]